MIIFGEDKVAKIVQDNRNNTNTVFIYKTLDSFRDNWQTSKMIKVHEDIRQRKMWNDYKHYPFFALEMYNPVVMSKLFMMVEALKYDVFDSDYFMWMDAGLLHVFNRDLSQEFVDRKFL